MSKAIKPSVDHDRANFERHVLELLRARLEETFSAVIADVNATGRQFERVEEAAWMWREPGAALALELHCALGVSYGKPNLPVPVSDPDYEFYFAQAQAGDADALLLMTLEMDVNNGGFSQLHVNQGTEFMRHAAAALARIGATGLRDLVLKALERIQPHGGGPVHPDALLKALQRLDVRYQRCKENIPALFRRCREGVAK